MAEKRLINAWDMIEWLDNIDKANQLRLLRGKKAKWLDTKGVRHMVDTLPTVDAVEVVHGRWLFNPDSERYFCSACDKYAIVQLHRGWDGTEYCEEYLTNYCPNCGASMRDGDGNG